MENAPVTQEKKTTIHDIFQKEKLLREQIIARYNKAYIEKVAELSKTIMELSEDTPEDTTADDKDSIKQAKNERMQALFEKARHILEADKTIEQLQLSLDNSWKRTQLLAEKNIELEEEMKALQEEREVQNAQLATYRQQLRERKAVIKDLSMKAANYGVSQLLDIEFADKRDGDDTEPLHVNVSKVTVTQNDTVGLKPIVPLPPKPALDITFHDENTILINPNTVTMRDGEKKVDTVDIELDNTKQNSVDLELSGAGQNDVDLALDFTEHKKVPAPQQPPKPLTIIEPVSKKESFFSNMRRWFTRK
jgi:hypothetical protein